MAFISKIADYIIDNYDLTKEYLIIVFPNKRAALTLRNELSKKIKTNIWLPQMLSIQEAMSSWSGLNLVDNIDVIFELIKIFAKSNELSASKNLFSLASQIVKDFDEIDQYAVDPKKLFNYLKEVKELELWTPDLSKPIESSYLNFFNSLHGFYISLKETLLKNKNAYYGMITNHVYNMTDEELENITANKKIIFAGFNAMTLTEEKVIVRLIESGKAVILWDLDKYYFEDKKQEAGAFARNFFQNHPQIKPTFLNNNFIDENKDIKIIGVSGSGVQANALQLQLLKNENSNKEAIILADEKLLIPVLNSIPDKYKQLHVTMGYPYSKTIINTFIRNIFAFQNSINKNENTIYFWGLLNLLQTELCKIIFNKNDFKQLLQWQEDKLCKSIFYINVSDYDTLKENSNIHTFLKLISQKWDSPSDCLRNIKDILKNIYQLVSNTDNSNFIKNQISSAGRIINKIENLLLKHNISIKISDIESIYKQAASEMNINLKGDIDGLQIMGLLETRNLDFNTIHILSVNEGVLPQSKSNNSLIPFDLRIIFKLPIYKNKQAVYAYHFYRLLQNAQNINIYYNTLSDGMGEGELSRFIRQIIHELPSKNKNINIKEIFYQSPEFNNGNKTQKIIVEKNEEIIKKIEKKLLGLSPTSINCYLNCPLQFYIKYIENIQENTTDELIQNNIIGNIIHNTLQNLYENFSNKEIDINLYDTVVNDHLEDSYHKALISNNFTEGLPEKGFNYLTKKMIEKLIKDFIEQERKFIIKNDDKPFKILCLEELLSHKFTIDEKEVYLIGYADRIDKVGDKIRVIDYKTGSIHEEDLRIKKNTCSLKDLKDKSLQLIIYKYLYAKKNFEDLEKIEPGIFGLRKISKDIFLLKNESEIFDNNNFISTCDDLFINLFSEILDKNIPFTQTDDDKKCKNCDYKNICKIS